MATSSVGPERPCPVQVTARTIESIPDIVARVDLRFRKNLLELPVPDILGPKSFNIGAGMARLNTAAAFIKATMPLETRSSD